MMLRGLRSWRRTPGSAFLIVLALGLSGGAFLTLVSLLNALFWRELPVSHPGELVGVYGADRRRPDWVNMGIPASLFTPVPASAGERQYGIPTRKARGGHAQ